MASDILLIPEEPDVEAQKQVIEATHGFEKSTGVTCQIEIHTHGETWLLFCRDSQGRRKSFGGDELYIRYEEFVPIEDDDESKEQTMDITIQAVAIITDNQDGTYELDFVTTPTNPSLDDDVEGTNACLTVYLEYSNNIGHIPPPQKKHWVNGGYTHKKYTYSPKKRPPIRSFRPPISTLNLNSFERVFAFGDSTMDQFVRQRPNKKGKYYFQGNLQVGEKMRLPMNSETVETHLRVLQEQLGEELSSCKNDNSTAMIIGSCLWDILDAHDALQGREYTDHLKSCRCFVERIRQLFPHVKLIWKSPMAVHIHWVELERLIEHDKQTATLFGIDRVKYMSSSRARFLYERQTELMRQLQVDVIDLFEATYLSADRLYPSDGRHYRPDLNRLMLQWYYRD